MNNQTKKGTWVIFLSFAIAFLLTILPLPEVVRAFQPSWTLLILSYWTMALPHRVGLLWAFICGLFLDSLVGVTLGIDSFAFIVMVFILKYQYKRLRLFPAWKQALVIFVLSNFYLGILYWLAQVTGKPEYLFAWQSAISNAIIWPGLFIVLRSLRRYFAVN